MAKQDTTVSADALDFLYSEEELKNIEAGKTAAGEEIPDVPTGSGGAGLAGVWQFQAMYRSWCADITKDDIPDDLSPCRIDEKRSGSFVYWPSMAAAEQERHEIGGNNADMFWTMTLLEEDIAGDVPDWFEDERFLEVQVTSLLPEQRHGYHMYMLPSLAQQLAIATGNITDPIFDYSTLNTPIESIDEAYQAEVIGKGKNYQGSTLWKAREEIWALMGEDNPDVYTVGQDPATSTTSKTLARVFQLVYAPRRLNVNIATMPDPHPKAKFTIERENTDDGTVTEEEARRRIPVVLNFWMSEDAMIAEVGAKTAVTSGGLAVPEQWASDPNDWTEYVKSEWAKQKGPKAKRLKAIEETDYEDYACTADDVLAWIDHLELA